MDLPDAWAAPVPARRVTPPTAAERLLDLPKSKVIARLRYHAEARELVVEFRNGSAYRYFGVLPEAFDALAAAPSPGARFNQDIAPYHEHERIA